jgi:hypothetical protein
LSSVVRMGMPSALTTMRPCTPGKSGRGGRGCVGEQRSPRVNTTRTLRK